MNGKLSRQLKLSTYISRHKLLRAGNIGTYIHKSTLLRYSYYGPLQPTCSSNLHIIANLINYHNKQKQVEGHISMHVLD